MRRHDASQLDVAKIGQSAMVTNLGNTNGEGGLLFVGCQDRVARVRESLHADVPAIALCGLLDCDATYRDKEASTYSKTPLMAGSMEPRTIQLQNLTAPMRSSCFDRRQNQASTNIQGGQRQAFRRPFLGVRFTQSANGRAFLVRTKSSRPSYA